MSSQTILENSKNKIYSEAIVNTTVNSEKFMYLKYYRLGKGFCSKNQFHNSIILDMFKLNSCSLDLEINNVIKNGAKIK